MTPFIRKTTLLLLECFTVLVVMASVAAGVLMWRLQQGPIAVDFVKSILAQRIADQDPSVSLTFDSALLTWPNWREPLVIEVKNLQLSQGGEIRLRLPDAALSIARLPLLVGQIKPVAAIFRQPDFRFIRTADNRFLLMSAVPGQAVQKIDSAPQATTDLTGLIALFYSFAADKPLTASAHNAPTWPAFLAEFEAIQVEDAVILFENEDGHIDWALPHTNAKMQRTSKGLEASIISRIPGEETMVTTLSAIPDKTGGLAISARANNFPLISPLRSFILDASSGAIAFDKTAFDASMTVNFTNTAHITLASGTLNIPAATVTMQDILPTPLTITEGQIGFDYASTGDDGTFSVRPSQLRINNVPMTLEGELKRTESSVQGPLRMHVTDLPISTLHGLWPLAIKETQAGIWLTDKIKEGLVETADFSLILNGAETIATPNDLNDPDDLDLTLGDGWLDTGLPVGSMWQWGVNDVTATYQYSNLTLDYQAPLTQLTKASGIGSYKDETLNVGITEGKLDGITVRNGNVMIDQIETKGVDSNTVLTLPISGSLASLMTYLALEPVGLDKELLADPARVTGSFDATTIIRFPAIYDLTREHVAIEVSGKASDVTWPAAAIGLPLRNGTLNIAVKDGQLGIQGQGLFDTAPVTFDWTRNLTPPTAPAAEISTLKATLQSDDTLRPKLGFPAGDSVTGMAPLTITYSENARSDGTMTIAADLSQATLNISTLGYAKPAGQAAKGQGTLVFTQDALTAIRDISLSLPDGKIEGGQMTLQSTKGEPALKELQITRIQLPNQDFNLRLTRPQADMYDINITATTFDARPFLSPAPTTTGKVTEDDPMRYTIALKTPTLQTTDKYALRDVHLALLTARDDSLAALNLTAKAEGSSLSARFDAPALTITADNAGHSLRALGIYDTILDGRMMITGLAQNGETTAKLQGETVLDDFAVIKAPALARLLNTLSLSGIGGLLENKGLHFKRLRTGFTWIDTGTEKSVSFQDGRTSGASLGLTFEGILNRASQTLDLKGTIIPMSEINKLIGNIPIIGNILLGGKNGSLIAATYTLKGAYADPQVFINPLSVLTPGFIRTILFEQDKAPTLSTLDKTPLND